MTAIAGAGPAGGAVMTVRRPRTAIGIGCRAGCPTDAIESLMRTALARLPGVEPLGVFTIADKKGEGGPIEAAARLGFDLVYLPRVALREREASVQTLSPRARAEFGVPSVAEAAALAGAGPGSVLLLPRIANRQATCAIAGQREETQ